MIMPQVETREIATIERDPMIAAFLTVLEPTDETLRLRGSGKGCAIYDEIKRDPHAFSVLQKRSLEVVQRNWHVAAPDGGKRIDTKAAKLAETQLKSINFDRLTRGLMGAVLKGFAVAEVMWANVDGTWTAAAVKVRKQRRFKFTVDGDLRLLTRENPIEGEPVPDRKFIVHRHSIDDDDDDPYGVGLGSVLYWPAWFKRNVLAHWLRGGERFAAPTVDAAYEGAYDEKRQKEVLQSLRSLANDAGIAHPKSVELKLLESTRGGGGDLLEAMSRYLDELMSEAVLGETLSTNSGERGARSLGEIHNEVRIAIAKADADLVSATIRDTLLRWIVELNLPGAQLPEVWRDFDEAEDLDDKVERDGKIVQMGYRPKSVDYINETYGGDWVEKAEPAAPEEEEPQVDSSDAEDVAAMDKLFDDRADIGDPELLADQLEQLAAPEIDGLVAAMRAAVDQAVSWDDLSTRLLKLTTAFPQELAGLLEEAETVAALQGHANVIDEGRGD
jgi:phage gp29-like protein